MSSQSAGLERLQSLNRLLPPRCQGCITGVANIHFISGLSDTVGEDEAHKTIDEIDRSCEGHLGESVDLRDYLAEDGKPLIPLSLLLRNPDCPFARIAQAEVDESWRRMNS